MLNARFLFLLLVINSALSFKKDTKLQKKVLLPKPRNCASIKCPTVEQPVCARLVYRNAGNKTVHVIMVNKCEMNYVKCHEGSKRSKREVQNAENPAEAKREGYYEKQHLIGSPTNGEAEAKPEGYYEKQHLILPIKEQQKVLKKPLGEDLSSQNEEGDNTKFNEFGDHEESLSDINENHSAEYSVNMMLPSDSGDDNLNSGEDLNGLNEEDEYTDSHEIGSNEEFNKEEGFEARMLYVDVDKTQYKADCPTKCPERDIMVCAKCQHGIYRTFLSICHMRMFNCGHTDESLQLITRLPCVMSAPYLSEAALKPAGRVREPGDDDRVLRFLRCRDLYTQQSREKSYKCIFDDVGAKNTTDPYQLDDNY